jgi:hypothetical protein
MRTLCLFSCDLDQSNPLKRLRFGCFRWFPWEGVLEGWLSIPLDLTSFGGPNLSYGMPMRYS